MRMLYFVKEGVKSTFANAFMSLSSIFAVSIAICMFGMFAVMKIHMNKFIEYAGDACKICVYLKENLSDDHLYNVKSEINGLDHVKSVELVTKQQAFEDLKQIFKNKSSLVEIFKEDNPLRDSFKVTLDKPENVEDFVSRIGQIKSVASTSYKENAVKAVIQVIGFIKFASLVLMVFFATVSILIVSNAVKVVIFSRRKEISIMKFVGATSFFIRMPYLVEGFLIGLVGSIFGYFVVVFFYNFSLNFPLFNKFSNIGIIDRISLSQFNNIILWKFLIFGPLLGTAGSFMSIKKYLKV